MRSTYTMTVTIPYKRLVEAIFETLQERATQSPDGDVVLGDDLEDLAEAIASGVRDNS